MTESNTKRTEHDALIRGLVDALSEQPEPVDVMPTTDPVDVIRSQLTENTGRHLLDTGMYGRAWEENRDNPPWEQPAWDYRHGYPTENVYHRMSRTLGRGRACVALEAALYGYAKRGPGKGDSWLSCMESFAEDYHRLPHSEVVGWVGETVGEVVLADLPAPGALDGYERDRPTFTENTYNTEHGTASQVLQYTALGGPYAEYVMVQVHGGADVRGGYTAPRVYTTGFDGAAALGGGEYWARCERCGWEEAESCLHRSDALIWADEPATGEVFRKAISQADRSQYDGLSVHGSVRSFKNDPDTLGVCVHADGCGGRVDFI